MASHNKRITKVVPHKPLTYKENKLVAARASGKTVLQAANEAEYLPNASDETRRVEAHRTLQKPHVKNALEIAMQKHNITLDRALAPVSKALEAKNENGDDDILTQLKGSDRALKLLGMDNNSGQNGSIHFHLHQAKQKYNL